MSGKTQTTNSSSQSVANSNSLSASAYSGGSNSSTSGTSSNTSGASAAALPYINTALGDLSASRDAASGLLASALPGLQSLAGNITSSLGQNDPNLETDIGYATDVLNGKGIDNPYMQSALDAAARNATNGAMAASSLRGIAGGSEAGDLVARSVFDAEQPLLQSDWNNRMQMRMAAASLIPQLVQAKTGLKSSQLSNLGALVNLPYAATAPYANAVGGLVGNWLTNTGSNSSNTSGSQYGSQYGASNTYGTENTTGTSTTKESGGLLGSILGGIFSLGSAAIQHSDIRLKEDIKRVGQTDAGLPIYTYRYKGDPKLFMGVMAQDVEQVQPEALGPVLNGYKTVNYAEIR